MSLTKSGELIFDNHELQQARTCPKLYYFSMIRHRSRKAAKKTAAEFGSAFHLGSELHDKGDDEWMKKACQYFVPFMDMEDDKRTLPKLQLLLELYYAHYGTSSYEVKPENLEVGACINLTPDVLYASRLDKVVTWNSDGQLWGWDIKTTSMMNDYVVKPHNQFSGYIYTLTEMFEHIGGLIVDLIGVYKTKPAFDKSGNFKEGSGPSDIFSRIPTMRTKNEIAQWKQETIDLIEDIQRWNDQKKWWKNTENCKRFYRRCPYYDVCNYDPTLEEDILMNDELFEDRVWIPYDEDGGEE